MSDHAARRARLFSHTVRSDSSVFPTFSIFPSLTVCSMRSSRLPKSRLSL
jgi:hypothetical protein